MPKIHCKHCKATVASIGDYGRHMAKRHREILKAQLAKGRRAHHKNGLRKARTRSDKAPARGGGPRLNLTQLYTFLAMIQGLIRLEKGGSKRRGKKKRKSK
jgi:hypothetical protein